MSIEVRYENYVDEETEERILERTNEGRRVTMERGENMSRMPKVTASVYDQVVNGYQEY